MLQISNKKSQGGFALLELVIAIAVIGLLSVGVISLANRVFQAQGAQRLSSGITDMATALKTIYAPQGNFKGINSGGIQALINAKSIPSGIIADSSANTISHNWNGQITLSPIGVGNVYGATFAINVKGLPGSVCNKLLTLVGDTFNGILYNKTTTGDLTGGTITTGSLKNPRPQPSAYIIAKDVTDNSLEVSNINTACSPTGGNLVTLSFIN